MALEWLPRDEAARTLGVGIDALQAWIDDGRAPTRTQDGQVQVLIEFTDTSADDGPPEAGAGNGHDGAAPRAHAETVVIDDGPTERDAPGRGRREDRVTVVDERQLQLAGGMVAAWQRVAESADQELTRSRRLGTVAWSLVAALVLAGGVGVWRATRAVSSAESDLGLAQYEQKQLAGQVRSASDRATDLDAQLRKLQDESADRQAKLTQAVEKAALASSQVEKLLEQNRLLTEAGRQQSAANAKVLGTLEDRIAAQAQRITALEKALSESNTQLAALGQRLAESQEQLTETLKQLRQTDARLTEADRKLSLQRDAASEATRQRDAAGNERDNLRSERDRIQAERDALAEQRAALQSRFDAELKKSAGILDQLTQSQARSKELESALKAAHPPDKAAAKDKPAPPTAPDNPPAPQPAEKTADAAAAVK
jgi:hypothetical protein